MESKKTGRPPKKPGERHSKWVFVRLTPDEHKCLQKYAASQGKPLGTLLRELALHRIGYEGEAQGKEKK